MKNFDVIKLRTLPVLLILVLQTGCLMPGGAAATPTIAPTTMQPTQTSVPTNTSEPISTPTSEPSATPTVVPTSEPVNAIAKTSVTIRSRPSKGSDNLGGVYANEVVKVIARNITANWYYILTSAAPDGKAWVLAAGFKLQGDLTRLSIAVYPSGSVTPIIMPPIIYEVPGGVPLPLNPPAPGAPTGLILQKARVRVGPSVGYM